MHDARGVHLFDVVVADEGHYVFKDSQIAVGVFSSRDAIEYSTDQGVGQDWGSYGQNDEARSFIHDANNPLLVIPCSTSASVNGLKNIIEPTV